MVAAKALCLRRKAKKFLEGLDHGLTSYILPRKAKKSHGSLCSGHVLSRLVIVCTYQRRVVAKVSPEITVTKQDSLIFTILPNRISTQGPSKWRFLGWRLTV